MLLKALLSTLLLIPAHTTVGARLSDGVTPQRTVFDYDKSVAVDVREVSVVKHDGFDVHDITYDSPKNGRVTAFLVSPNDTKMHAGIIFQHWGMGDRREFLAEAAVFSRIGAVSILVDAPWARPEPWKSPREGNIDKPQIDRDLYVQTVVDIRRAVDVLLTRRDIDRNRIAFVGHSYGATWGGALAGVEHRIKAFVLIAGLPSISDFAESGASKNDAIIDSILKTFDQRTIHAYKDVLDRIQPVLYVGMASPSAIFMQFADEDVYISGIAAQQYFDAAKAPKKQKWYFASHEVNDPEALADRVNWLTEQLRLERKAGLPNTPLPTGRH